MLPEMTAQLFRQVEKLTLPPSKENCLSCCCTWFYIALIVRCSQIFTTKKNTIFYEIWNLFGIDFLKSFFFYKLSYIRSNRFQNLCETASKNWERFIISQESGGNEHHASTFILSNAIDDSCYVELELITWACNAEGIKGASAVQATLRTWYCHFYKYMKIKMANLENKFEITAAFAVLFNSRL